MVPTAENPHPAALLANRLLAGPARPGQAFTMPGCNYDQLYRLARRLKAWFDGNLDADAAVCLFSDDRAVMAAALLASLAGGPVLILPDALSAAALADLARRTGFDAVIGQFDTGGPAGMTAIDPQTLTDEVETLASTDEVDINRPWVRLATGGATGALQLWTKTPGNLLEEVDYLINRFDIGSGDRILSTVPALHNCGLLFSLLIPLAAASRVAAASPSLPGEIDRQMAAMAPTVFIGTPVHYHALQSSPPDKGTLRLAFSSAGLPADDGRAFSEATQVDLIEIYGFTETGGIATRCRAKGEAEFTPYDCIQARVAGEELDIRSPFLSTDLPVRSSGWFSVTDRVQTMDGGGFVPARQPDRKAGGTSTDAPRVTFEPPGLKVPLEDGKSIHELAAASNIDLRADCGGMGICAKCRVLVHPRENFSPPTEAELDVLTPDQMEAGFRLACQARAIGKATVTIPDTLAESAETRGKTGIARSYPANSPIRRLTVTDRSPGLTTDSQPESLLDWLAAQIGEPLATNADLAALRQLSRYRDSLKTFTLVVHDESGIRRILDGRRPISLGLAVDLGTTSVAGYLCDLKSGELLAADACVNPQRRFGEDVISRISRVNEEERQLGEMQRLAMEAVNLLMTRCLEKIGGAPADIDEVAVCGNTTMQQIFAGLHPYGLGVFPYFPLTLTPPAASAGSLGLAVDPAVPVFLTPVISGFVGGDTMAVILADRPHERDATTLIVDIGTNGEVVLGNRQGLWVTSCATGPALEGAQISCGMRAVTGAIHRVWEDGTGGIAYEVIGNAKNRPIGLCGSGIIDAVAALHRIGVILPNGRLNEASPGVATDDTGVGRQFTLAAKDRSATGSEIAVTLKDVRQIQLAKGALCTGIEFLMRRAGITKIDRTILTGAFGARFNWENALSIGMLPPAVAAGTVTPQDNLAGVGVVKALLDKDLRTEARDLCRRIRYLELAADPEFAMAFAKATAFPDVAV